MLGRFFYLHIVKSTPCNQSYKRLGFFIFTQTFTSYFTFVMVFHIAALILSLKLRFRISSLAMNSQQDISKKDFIKTSYSYAKFTFSSVAYLYSLSILTEMSTSSVIP